MDAFLFVPRWWERGGWWRLAAVLAVPAQLVVYAVGWVLGWVIMAVVLVGVMAVSVAIPLATTAALIGAIWIVSWIAGSPTHINWTGEEAPARVSSGYRPACDPNYSGCVPDPGYDVDCAEVGETVRVIGTDIDGLDADGDGYGCDAD